MRNKKSIRIVSLLVNKKVIYSLFVFCFFSMALHAQQCTAGAGTYTSGTGDAAVGAPAIISLTSSAPTIDGTIDAGWANTPSHTISKNVVSTYTNGTTRWRAMYDATYLYVLVEVTDGTLVNNGGNGWEDDAVEIHIDGGNDKATTYDGNDFQYGYIYGASNASTANMYGTATRTGISWAIPSGGGGYILETRIPWSTVNTGGSAVAAGKMIGFDIYINDDDDGGSRDNQGGWYSTSTTLHTNINPAGLAKLKDCSACSTGAGTYSSGTGDNAVGDPGIIYYAATAPTIDGTVDTDWGNASTHSIAKNVVSTYTNGTTRWRAMYDATYLYVLVEVTDGTLVNNGGNGWED
ncbi:MAG: hypothetical protein NT150_14780, partial [Bacteroidetes bacterium]|nr:hypothetical protein [Bacteroidota bacterium]